MSNKIKLQSGILILMVVVAAFVRLLPHPPNFTPIAGMALFSGAYFARKYMSFIVPLAAFWLSDMFYNNIILPAQFPEYYTGFQWFGNLWVYAAFVLIVAIGMGVLKKVSTKNVAIAVLSSSVLFFLITNFGAWAAYPTYTKDLTGLLAAYTAGIPFFGNTLMGDLFFSGVMFGSYEWMKNGIPSLRTAK